VTTDPAAIRRLVLATSLALAAAANVVRRQYLAMHFHRTVFHSSGDTTPFAKLRDLPTTHRILTRDNLRDALIASGSIPLLVEGVRIAGFPGETHWDGGVVDRGVGEPPAGAKKEGGAEQPAEQERSPHRTFTFDGPHERDERDPSKKPVFKIGKCEYQQAGGEECEQGILPRWKDLF